MKKVISEWHQGTFIQSLQNCGGKSVYSASHAFPSELPHEGKKSLLLYLIQVAVDSADLLRIHFVGNKINPPRGAHRHFFEALEKSFQAIHSQAALQSAAGAL